MAIPVRRVRLYGPTIGHGSFCRVTAGMREGLEAHGAFAGLVPLDRYDEDRGYEGHDADIGVYVGPPDRVALMSGIGEHRERWLLLPPNSSWVPSAVLGRAWPYVTGFLAPSRWAEEVLRRAVDAYGAPVRDRRAVALWRHGVAPGFRPSAGNHAELVEAHRTGHFWALHMASSTAERKGTRELLQAWGSYVDLGYLGPAPLLRLVVDGQTDDMRELLGPSERVQQSVVWSRGRWNMDVAQAAHHYQKHHVLVAPSRGEGFGLCPLEARGSGVAVVATRATGHAEHLGDAYEQHGVVGIPTHGDAPIDDGPGAMAPELLVADVAEALQGAFERWQALGTAAQAEAPSVGAAWSWPRVTEDWLRGRS